jgi:hypothetical protein
MRWTSIFALLLLCTPSHAWNDTGHRLAALIAYDRLTPDRRTQLINLLHHHPRFEEDFTKRTPRNLQGDDRARWLFSQAAVWPDLARDYRNLDGRLYTRFHRGPWHYVNKPVFLDAAARQALAAKLPPIREEPVDGRAAERMNILQAINHNVSLLNDPAKPEPDRAVALCWVLHLVGDLHQPLHAAGLYSASRFSDLDGDRGGNEIPVAGVEGARNLHALWDNLPGDSFHLPWLTNEAAALAKQVDPNKLNEKSRRAWMEESYSLARSAAYTEEVLKIVREGESRPEQQLRAVVLSEPYLKTATATARERLALAGARLAIILSVEPQAAPVN